MKRNLFTIIIAIMLIVTGIPATHAGFVIAPKSSTAAPAVAPVDAKEKINAKKQTLLTEIRERFRNAFSFKEQEHSNAQKSSWQSFVSFGCSLLGLILVFVGFGAALSEISTTVVAAGVVSAIILGLLCGAAGIVFGILGVRRKKHKFRGFALAGIILGSIDIFFLAVVLAVAIALA